MALDKDTSRFKGTIAVSLKPINKYGDAIPGDAILQYSIEFDGSLMEAVRRLEYLKKGE